jgi:urease accessory protein
MMDAALVSCPAEESADRKEGKLELHFAPDAEGRSYLAHQFASYPFHVCRAQYLDPELPEMASLYLQSSAGGLFAGDRLSLRIAAAAGAKAHVTTPASTIVHRMPEGEARQRTLLEAGSGSFLEYLPDPVILFPQARLRSRLRLRLGDGATAILADAFLPHDPAGAHEAFGSYESETEIEDAGGRRLVLDRFRVSGADAQAGAAGVMGGHAMQATILAVSSAVAPEALLTALRQGMATCGPPVYGAASLLPNGCGAWARLLAEDGAALTGATTQLWAAAREAVSGFPPRPRRK